VGAVQISDIAFSETFQRDFKKAPPEVQAAVGKVLEGMKQNPQPKKLRIHSVNGCFDPKIFKADVLPNHSWQITFHIEGTTAILRRLGTHKLADRDK
jgi:mRNA-degrading endonuclease YafQ of YafQ-DinJ toxin-antitoxin module